MSIWGMPNMDVIQELELEGHTVNIEGCVPPFVGEEVFPFKCKKCGHKFGDFEDVFWLEDGLWHTMMAFNGETLSDFQKKAKN